jgi:hypothetical protein
MPDSYSVSFTGTFKYPYTVSVRAYDCFYEYGEFSQKMVDMTEENTIAATKVDARIDELLNKELTAADLETVVTMRKELNKLSYKIKNLMNKLDEFEAFEKEYFNKYFITDCADEFAPTEDDCFSISPLTSRGWVENSNNIGVRMNWKDATKNYFMGFSSKVDLDGLHLGFTNLSISSENKSFGILFSNEYKDKWLSNEALLINIDFNNGSVTTGKGVAIGRSDLLTYSNIGSIPFDLKFNMVDGGMTMQIISPLGNEVLTLPAAALSGMSHFTDPSQCYVSFSPWDTKTTMSVDVTAVHTEEAPVEPDIPTDPGEDTEQDAPELNFFQRIWLAIVNFFKKLFGIN